ncbi:MAG: hypothetical protein C4575_09455 [Desulforudis sp.]|nr:MAG: hypothetical protein C4575_09455 [Desulforudis sp.]
MLKAALRLTVIAALILLIPALSEAASWKGRCVAVLDGDSLIVMRHHQPVTIRLYGVDAPEMKQPFGPEAKNFTAGLALDKRVTVKVNTWDRYGRTVAEIILPDGRNLGHELLRAGLAWWYKRYAVNDQELKELEAKAKSEKINLWSDDGRVPPWIYRKSYLSTIPLDETGSS